MSEAELEFGALLLKGIETVHEARKTFGKICDDDKNVDNNFSKVFGWLVQADNILSQPQYKDSARQLSLLYSKDNKKTIA